MKTLTLIAILILQINVLGQNTTVNYTEDTNGYIRNPERGWYYSWDAEPNGLGMDWFTNHDSPMTLARLQQIKADYNVTVIRKYYSLWDFRNGADISADYLQNHIQNDLDVVKAAGMKLICVVIYNWSEDMPIEDASLTTMKRHIQQLKPYWEANAAQVYAWFAGFIGNDGEWRASSNGNMNGVTTNQNANCWQLVDALMAGTPANRMIHIRFPGYTIFRYPNPATATEAYNQSNNSRVGFENLGFLYNADDWSTWTAGINTEAEKRAYIQAQTKYSSSIGEPAGETEGVIYAQSADVLGQLSTYHWSALNMSWPPANPLINHWKSNGMYENIARKLGYRYILNNAVIPNSVKKGNKFDLSLSLKNDGYSGIQNPRKIEIILRNRADGNKYVLNVVGDDLVRYNRTYLPNASETKTLNITGGIRSTMPEGNYDVILNLPDPYDALHDRPEYSIRLANTGTWEQTTGYNILGTTIINNTTAGITYNGTNYYSNPNLSINTTIFENSLRLYPNPATQNVTLEYNLLENAFVNVSIYDVLGKEVQQVKNENQTSGSQKITLDVSKLKKGIYFIKINVDGYNETKKLIIE